MGENNTWPEICALRIDCRVPLVELSDSYAIVLEN